MRAVDSHISQKTSEMWGTHVRGGARVLTRQPNDSSGGLGVVGRGRDTAPTASPIGVEEFASRFIDAFVGVGTEEVSLRLQ